MLVQYIKKEKWDKDTLFKLRGIYYVVSIQYDLSIKTTYIGVVDDVYKEHNQCNLCYWKITNSNIPPGWIFRLCPSSGGFTIEPREFAEALDGYFWEHYHNADPDEDPIIGSLRPEYKKEQEALRIFKEVTKKIEKFHEIEEAL